MDTGGRLEWCCAVTVGRLDCFCAITIGVVDIRTLLHRFSTG
jgi:hypothetical protein